jgi:hypothetical protein
MEAGVRVLVAEDDTLIAMLMEDVLVDDGHEVIGPVPTAMAALNLSSAAFPIF